MTDQPQTIKEHRIFCVVCGTERVVKTQNWKQVKRCITCQYAEKQAYNTRYIREKRKLNKITNDQANTGGSGGQLG